MNYLFKENLFRNIFRGQTFKVEALKYPKVLIFAFLFLTIFFLGNSVKADYYASGIMQSENVLSKADVSGISEFVVVATIPASTTVSISFSQDKSVYYNASSTKGGWTDFTTGTTTIDLSGLSWTGALLFYKLKLETTDASTTPTVSEIRVNYTGTAVPAVSGDYYYGQGILQSTNMLSGLSITSIDSFYATTSLLFGTEAQISFSQDKTIFYSASGTKAGWDILSDGGNFIDLSGLSWSGSSLYYKIKLISMIDNAVFPKVTDVKLVYTESSAPAVTPGDYYYQGVLLSSDLLASTTDVLTGYERFGYTISYLPFGATVKVQFSQDQLNWYSSDGTAWGYDTMTFGDHLSPNTSLDLFGLGWKSASNFYYKIKYQLGADNSTSPVIKDAGILYSSASMTAGTKRAGPVAYWKFDEGYGATVHDETGNGNDGTASSSNSGTNTNVSQMWDLDGKYNKTMEFDGVDDYVDIGNLTETPEGTISLWFKLDNAINSGSNTNSGLFLNSNPVATPTMLARWYDSEGGGALDFWISDSGGWKNLKTKRTSWEANVWYNVLLTWDGTYMKSYINGEYDEVSVVGPPQPVASNTWRLGVSSSGVTPYYFDGKIDELKIYNYALSADETKQAYNRGVAVVVGSTGTDASGNKTNSDLREYCVPGDTSPCTPPTLEFKLDEKQGTTAYDTSGNGNDGILGGDGIGTDLPTWTQGQNGSGLEFDGTDDYLSFQDIPFGGTNPITVCGWGRSDSIVSNHVLVHQGTEIVLRLNNNNIEWILNSFTTNDRLAIPIGISIEEWTYFCGVYESGGDLIVYLNGKEEGRVTPTGTYANSGAQFELGRLNTAQEAWDGAIDDVKIYDYARTGAQIAWDYNKGKPIAHWDFDECSGSTAHDQNANANPGTITIGPSGTQTSLGNCSTASTSTAWYNGRDGKINESLNFDGTDDYISVGDTGLDINTISFWIKQGYSDNFFIDLNGGTSTITLANSVITTTGFSLPTIYIDGIEKSTILDNVWHQVTVMTDTSIYVNNLDIGKINTGYYTGLFDEIKLYNYPLTEEQVKIKYNNGAVKFGG